LNKEIVHAIADPTIAGYLVKLGTAPVSTSPAEFAAFIKSEGDKWGKVIKAAGIKAN